jgi:hypothetical protein
MRYEDSWGQNMRDLMAKYSRRIWLIYGLLTVVWGRGCSKGQQGLSSSSDRLLREVVAMIGRHCCSSVALPRVLCIPTDGNSSCSGLALIRTAGNAV